MSLKSSIGLDWFELMVHVSVTALGMIVLESLSPGGRAEEVLMSGALAVSILVLAFRRSRAVGRQASAGMLEEERVAQIEDRLMELEAAQQRVMELEERVDFTERLLARERELKLGAGREG